MEDKHTLYMEEHTFHASIASRAARTLSNKFAHTRVTTSSTWPHVHPVSRAAASPQSMLTLRR